MRVPPLAAAALAGAATLSVPAAAQPPAPPPPPLAPAPPAPPEPPDDLRAGDTVRDYTVRRVGPARARGDVEVFRFDSRDERRSIVGLAVGEADALGLRVDGVAEGGPAARGPASSPATGWWP
jgi:hypothetical protein